MICGSVEVKPFLLVLLLALLCGTPAESEAADAAKPNIIFILADDLGYGDLACYGHPYARTPALDQLARDGTLFRNFHVTGVTCCPSRTGFMTGKFPASFHGYPADHGFGDRVTITDLLHKAGYRTGHFGKWHIGPDPKPGTYGIDVINSEKVSTLRGKADPRGRDANIYDEAIQFLEANKDVPFYMNVWDHIPHFPVNPPKSYVDKFKDLPVQKSDFFYSDTMLSKFTMVEKAGGKIDERLHNYLAELLSMDDCIARLLAKVDELGLREKTIVVFSSDQGAAPLRLSPEAGGASGGKNAQKTKGEKADLRLNMMGHGGELRGGKHEMYEGGVRVPFIIRWPGHVPAGRVEEKSVISAIDWLPTLCHLAGVTLPATDFDGEDVSDTWLGAAHDRAKPLFWKLSDPQSAVAILDGKWKLFTPGDRRRQGTATQLYDLSQDWFEKKNVADTNPDIVKALTTKIGAWNETLPKSYLKIKDTGD